MQVAIHSSCTGCRGYYDMAGYHKLKRSLFVQEGEEIQQPFDKETYLNHSTDDAQFNLITSREPEISFKFPARQYKDKRSKIFKKILLLRLV